MCTKKPKLGVIPIPNYPFEEVCMDLIEDLPPSQGYHNILLIQDQLTDFVILIPLRTKRSLEISKALYNSVLQIFNVKRIYCDNGSGFRNHDFLSEINALKIKMINTAVNHPAGKGKAESCVKIVKNIFRKMLATKNDYNWTLLPMVVAKILNNSISPRTQFRPAEMLLGIDGAGANLLNLDLLVPPHSFIKSHTAQVADASEQIASMTNQAKDHITQLKMVQNERENKKRVNRRFQVGDYVFCLNRTKVPGQRKALQLKLNPSPFVVLRPLWATSLCQRIADGHVCLFYNGDLKKFNMNSPLFANLPVEVLRVLLNDFQIGRAHV